MKNIKMIGVLFLIQIFYIGTILLSCVWDSTMFMALRVLTYFVWGFSLFYVSPCINRYEHTKKNRRRGITIYALGCISILTAQFVSAIKPSLVIALVFSVFLLVLLLVELVLIFDIRTSKLDETILELEKNPNKELFVGITKERLIKNHSLLATALFFGLIFTFVGVPILCTQDYFLGIKALLLLYACDIAILLMRLYLIKADVKRFLRETICFHISMMCLSFGISQLHFAMEQTIFQLGCILFVIPILYDVIKDIRRVNKEK